MSSDLLRARATAETIAERLGVPVRVEPAWREQGLGTLEGKLREDAWSHLPEEDWSADWRPEGGESTRDVYRRIAGFFAGLAATTTARELIVVTHGDALRIALGLLDGAPPEAIPWAMAPNGAVLSQTTVRSGSGVWRAAAGCPIVRRGRSS